MSGDLLRFGPIQWRPDCTTVHGSCVSDLLLRNVLHVRSSRWNDLASKAVCRQWLLNQVDRDRQRQSRKQADSHRVHGSRMQPSVSGMERNVQKSHRFSALASTPPLMLGCRTIARHESSFSLTRSRSSQQCHVGRCREHVRLVRCLEMRGGIVGGVVVSLPRANGGLRLDAMRSNRREQCGALLLNSRSWCSRCVVRGFSASGRKSQKVEVAGRKAITSQ
jgi:hypothetical protein